MITESAVLQIKNGQSVSFEADFRRAAQLIQQAPGYIHHRLEKCIERPHQYLLLVDWENLEDHTEGFRKSALYLEWKLLLHHYYSPFPEVDHYYAI